MLHRNGRPVACHQFQRIECHCDWLGLTQCVTLETQTSKVKKRCRDALGLSRGRGGTFLICVYGTNVSKMKSLKAPRWLEAFTSVWLLLFNQRKWRLCQQIECTVGSHRLVSLLPQAYGRSNKNIPCPPLSWPLQFHTHCPIVNKYWCFKLCSLFLVEMKLCGESFKITSC